MDLVLQAFELFFSEVIIIKKIAGKLDQETLDILMKDNETNEEKFKEFS